MDLAQYEGEAGNRKEALTILHALERNEQKSRC